MSTQKLPIYRLPLPKTTLQGTLPRIKLDDAPSAQRRSTAFPGTERGVWARTTPMWSEWPIRITKQEALELGCDVDKGQQLDIEDVLRRWDAGGEGSPVEDGPTGSNLKLRTSPYRLKLEAALLGVSDEARAAILPQLDIGDALDLEASYETGPVADKASPARAALVDVLSGRKMLESEDDSYGPWSTRYCGHQFAQWAGQLGDGRATSLIETASEEAGRQEIQVKGAGRTPFSRSADGLAVLRSGVREYLGCEAIAALGIPTTRALAILTAPVVVIRENGPEPASVVARVAPSFIRIGHFEAQNPGEDARSVHHVFLGGGWKDMQDEKKDKNDALGGEGNLETLRDLTAWVKNDIMGMESASTVEWFKEVAKRNAETAAMWQVYGFMHGVLNTDNISILGLTIDYGPYAFMDVWDPQHICNHSDPGGLYNYKNQPQRVLYALDSLLSSLLPLMGYEAEKSASATPGWSHGATRDDVRRWEALALEQVKDWNDTYVEQVVAKEQEGWAKRFGLRTVKDDDDREIFKGYLSMLSTASADFGASFRFLCGFDHAQGSDTAYLRAYATQLIQHTTQGLQIDSISRAEEAVVAWLKVYAARVDDPEETAAWAQDGGAEGREKAMKAVNPRFVLRQWVLEEVIKTMEEQVKAGNMPGARKALARVLDMSLHPFEAYGEDTCETDTEGTERARLCGLGPKGMVGFQCSCSS